MDIKGFIFYWLIWRWEIKLISSDSETIKLKLHWSIMYRIRIWDKIIVIIATLNVHTKITLLSYMLLFIITWVLGKDIFLVMWAIIFSLHLIVVLRRWEDIRIHKRSFITKQLSFYLLFIFYVEFFSEILLKLRL